MEIDPREFCCEFHHVQLYADKLAPMSVYKSLENQLNGLANKGSFDPFSGGMRFLEPLNALPSRVLEGSQVWKEMCEKGEKVKFLKSEEFSQAGQDVVEQLIVGLGWRVTAEYIGSGTRSVLVTSQDARGVKLVVTCKTESKLGEEEVYDHFASENLDKFYKCHDGFQGISVLGFELPEQDAMEITVGRYKKLHPKLFRSYRKYEDVRMINTSENGVGKRVKLGSMSVLEAYAYYTTDKTSQVDEGTVIRYVHREGSYAATEGFGNPQGVLPGLVDVPAVFDGTSIPAYSDHWVSNVTDRHSFLETLQDVLGFTPKVDFNAGVVAAGRAKIESTVTGNNTAKITNSCDSDEVLRDQSQVYLPINNALTDVGHVHGFLNQLGQGVQHLACRVRDLVGFIERVNNYRKITGKGFTFLRIPPSYYGRLDTERDLVPILGKEKANEYMKKLVGAKLCTPAGIIKLDIVDSEIKSALGDEIDSEIIAVVKKARYSNMYALLKDHFKEDTYLQIVRNQILVDIQANDVLFQIFTCNILQRDIKDEAPFLEFIQRVCSEKTLSDGTCAPIKPGCGGFGIRNFLTLFLSIEVSKAMSQVEQAIEQNNKEMEEKAQKRVQLFTNQLDESNPILTAISDAMTAEGDALESLKQITDPIKRKELEQLAKQNEQLKIQGQEKLQQLSDHYSKLMQQV